ncbi:PEP-CTERM sorting domain-containing protein [Thalassomonas viridans]|uniref:PEP-CTERM sorting domain-containing protein n=1 Tax=Thalassomonas viridans TaxID=137584 RepID=A0AAE9YXM1_9GAMM|nr:PEP-CTERM sorting domain-containing protein [Thalassomonas viridans]WDE02793.1 PEP-CTERM sorting domain-containing protein [Thalassomonas viridans]
MKNIAFMKNLLAIVLASSLSFGANATFMTIEADGGFVMKDAGEYTLLDGSADPDQTDGVKHAGVRWGGDGAFSSLILENFTPDIDALDTAYMLSKLTHNNFVISAEFIWLTTAEILGDLSFTSTNTGGIASAIGSSIVTDAFTADATSDFNIGFKETFNQAVVGDCSPEDEDGVAGGPSHVFTSACDDYFDYSVDNTAPLPDTLPFTIPFYIDGVSYALEIYISFDADGSTMLPPGRIWTEEELSTDLYTFARLHAIPEPSTLAIFALTLMGLVFSQRRKAGK